MQARMPTLLQSAFHDFGWRRALDGRRIASPDAFPSAALGRFHS